MWISYIGKQKNMFMKTNKLIISLLLIFCFCRCTSGGIEEEEYNEEPIVEENEFNLTISPGACFPEVNDKYVYPVVPGMEEWIEANKVLNGSLKLCQLPDSVLESISTPGLIDALIHAPEFTSGDYLFLGILSMVRWWNYNYFRFNSARELFQREDAGDALVAYYKLVCSDCIETLIGVDDWILSRSYYESFIYKRISGLEYLFIRPEILDNMEHIKKKEAVVAILGNYEQDEEPWHIFPLVYIMLADEYAPLVQYSQEYDEMFQSILNGYSYSGWEVVISFAKSYINEKSE